MAIVSSNEGAGIRSRSSYNNHTMELFDLGVWANIANPNGLACFGIEGLNAFVDQYQHSTARLKR